MELLGESALRAALTFLAGAGVALLGLHIYYKQKEFELVKQRYLEGAIDIAAADIELSFNALSHNWSRCLFLLKMYRDLVDDFDLRELKTGFLEVNTTAFNRIAFHRIYTLVQTEDLWIIYQLALAYLSSANSKIVTEVPEVIRLKITGVKIEERPEKIVEVGFKELRKLDEESHKFAEVVRVFQVLASELECSKLTFSAIGKFHERERVKRALSEMRAAFSEELEMHNNRIG